jgi:hypothetical protein
MEEGQFREGVQRAAADGAAGNGNLLVEGRQGLLGFVVEKLDQVVLLKYVRAHPARLVRGEDAAGQILMDLPRVDPDDPHRSRRARRQQKDKEREGPPP